MFLNIKFKFFKASSLKRIRCKEVPLGCRMLSAVKKNGAKRMTTTASRFPMTPEGFKKLEAELHNLKTVERHTVIEAIAEARAHGDLSENAEYSAAKEKQSFIETKIQDLESKLSRVQVIDIPSIQSDTIQFGATVTLVNEETDETCKYTIVSEYETGLGQGYISILSPIAKAMLGKKVGDSIEVNLPNNGVKYFFIEKLEFK